MKTKNYHNGRLSCKSYYRPVGKGWEVGFKYGPKTLFVGNFIHRKEANEWWTTMNREITTFSKKYKVSPKFPKTRYTHFLSSHLYNKYYHYLDRAFTQYCRTFNRAEQKDLRTYNAAHRKVSPRTKVPFLKAA